MSVCPAVPPDVMPAAAEESGAGLLEIPQCVGAKHSSLSRELEWQRLQLRDRKRPDFLITSVDMTDWQMLVEKWQTGHNMPRFTRDDQPQGPKRFTTTLQSLRASRGRYC